MMGEIEVINLNLDDFLYLMLIFFEVRLYVLFLGFVRLFKFFFRFSIFLIGFILYS